MKAIGTQLHAAADSIRVRLRVEGQPDDTELVVELPDEVLSTVTTHLFGDASRAAELIFGDREWTHTPCKRGTSRRCTTERADHG